MVEVFASLVEVDGAVVDGAVVDGAVVAVVGVLVVDLGVEWWIHARGLRSPVLSSSIALTSMGGNFAKESLMDFCASRTRE